MGTKTFSDDTVDKGTSKCHKTDEKAPILRCTFLHKYLIKTIISPLFPTPIKLRGGLILKTIPLFTEKCAPPFYHFFLLSSNTKKTIYPFVELLLISLILVHTRVRRVRNYYKMYTIKNHHFTRTYALDYLICIL